jgi:transposase-like protein
MEYTPHRKLTREFKLEVVRQAALSEKPKAQLARELGVRNAELCPGFDRQNVDRRSRRDSDLW